MSEEFWKKYGNTIVGLIVIVIWGFSILAMMLSIITKSMPTV